MTRAPSRARRGASKTLRRTRAYLAAALLARPPARDQVVVAWGLVAALAWGLPSWPGLAAFGGAAQPASPPLFAALVAVLLAIAAIDSRWGLIPDPLSLLVLVLGAAGALLAGGAEALWPALAGAVAVYGAGRLLGRLHVAWRGREGFGGGDVKLVAAAVPWVGLGGLPAMMTVAVASAFAGIALMRLDGPVGRGDAVPFGPHLALGLAWAAILGFGPG